MVSFLSVCSENEVCYLVYLPCVLSSVITRCPNGFDGTRCEEGTVEGAISPTGNSKVEFWECRFVADSCACLTASFKIVFRDGIVPH